MRSNHGQQAKLIRDIEMIKQQQELQHHQLAEENRSMHEEIENQHRLITQNDEEPNPRSLFQNSEVRNKHL